MKYIAHAKVDSENATEARLDTVLSSLNDMTGEGVSVKSNEDFNSFRFTFTYSQDSDEPGDDITEVLEIALIPEFGVFKIDSLTFHQENQPDASCRECSA